MPAWAAERCRAAGDARWRRAPSPDRWSAAEITAHLRDSDRSVHLPRVERMLSEEFPAIDYVDLSGADARARLRAEEPGAVLDDWRRARSELIARLAPLAPDAWRRSALHSTRGAVTLADLMRGAADHDLSHRRQIERALAEAT
jgi:hypothetical protein